MKITSNTKLYCIFGKPVSHSLSPVLHNTGFETIGMDAVYCAFEPTNIDSAINAMRTLGISGASITIPYKIDVMKHINEIDSLAKDIGSVNTLVNKNGSIIGYNTDGLGACKAMEDAGMKINGSKALIIGNGGSARAIAFSLLSKGCAITISGRNEKHIANLANDLKKKYSDVDYILLDRLDSTNTEMFTVIINTTPVGMEPNVHETPIERELLHEGQFVFDIVYKPDETRLLQEAAKKGCKIIKGFEMLLAQGALQFKLWTGHDAPVDEMRKAVVRQ